MKKALIISIIMAILLTACNGNTSVTTENTETVDIQTTENTDVTEITTDVTTPEISATLFDPNEPTEPVTLDGMDFRIIPADFSFLISKPTDISETIKSYNTYFFRYSDLSDFDLSELYDEFKFIEFTSDTIWSDKLPNGFEPDVIMENGKNPGLNIKSLHSKGITGKGVNISIIDYALLASHEQYADRLKYYYEQGSNGDIEFHGALVTSILAGKDIGTAPEANIYFIASQNVGVVDDTRIIDFTQYAKSVERIVELNKLLPEDEKIRVLSISAGWAPEHAGYAAMEKAVKNAKDEGIFVISDNLFETYNFWAYGLCKDAYSDPDDFASYSQYKWDDWVNMNSHIDSFVSYYEDTFNKNFSGEMLLIPLSSRTSAFPTANDNYMFSAHGGWSTMIPYLAGVYAMACQVKNDITPELFWETALKTGIPQEIVRGDKTYNGKLLNPEKLMEELTNM